MKKILIMIWWASAMTAYCQAQSPVNRKPVIDTSVFGHWPSLGRGEISNDGRYVSYDVKNLLSGSPNVTIRAAFGDWQVKLTGRGPCTFSKDNQWGVVGIGKDSLCLLRLGTSDRQYIGGISNWNFSGYAAREAFVCQSGTRLTIRQLTGSREQVFTGVKEYRLVQGGHQLVWEEADSGRVKGFHLLDMTNNKDRVLWSRADDKDQILQYFFDPTEHYLLWEGSIQGVHTLHELALKKGSERVIWSGADNKEQLIRYFFSLDGNALAWESGAADDPKRSHQLHWLDLPDGSQRVIWQGTAVTGLCFDHLGKQLAFAATGKESASLWYYRDGTDSAVCRVSAGSPGVEEGLVINAETPVFNKEGDEIFFYLQEPEAPQQKGNAVPVTIWSYRDDTVVSLQEQIAHRPNTKRYMAVTGTGSGPSIRLEKDGAWLQENIDPWKIDRYLLLVKGGFDDWWRTDERATVWLMDIRDGSKRLLLEKAPYAYRSERFYYTLSPGDRYLLYYDPIVREYFSYETATGVIRNLTRGLNAQWKDASFFDLPDPWLAYPSGIAGMASNGECALVYDDTDIWELDMSGKRRPKNITGGYGRAHQIRLRCIGGDAIKDNIIASSGSLLLSAFDRVRKYHGYYRKQLGKPGAPDSLSLTGYYFTGDMSKASNADEWLVIRSRAAESPNWYLTKDLKTFTEMSDVHPEKEWNWLTAELVSWQMPDGRMSQGILYKPEDFDANKKYPLILNYYDKKSDGLYKYLAPGPARDELNIPYFVSRGYLVFLPDIWYRLGYTGESAREAIVSAAEALAKNAWVDSTRMGIQGHSFGGFETNYVVTHSHLFAAAAESAGQSDFISCYGLLAGGMGASGGSRNFMYEIYQDRLNATLWEHPERYITNSPVLKADQVTTPLLMRHSQGDGSVPYSQAIELYTALRRLGKRAWLLEYSKGGHSLTDDKDALDYTLRMEQFFNHYLKGSLPPRWMTEGIPVSRRGIDTGYEPDSSGRKP